MAPKGTGPEGGLPRRRPEPGGRAPRRRPTPVGRLPGARTPVGGLPGARTGTGALPCSLPGPQPGATKNVHDVCFCALRKVIG